MEEIASLISNVGFPIACTIVLFYNNSNFTKVLNDVVVTLKEMSTRLESLEDTLSNINKQEILDALKRSKEN